MKVKNESEVVQSCQTLRDPIDCSLPGSSVHGILQARIVEWVACLCEGIFPIQGLNPDVPHCRWILYHLSQQGSPRILEWVTVSLSTEPLLESPNKLSSSNGRGEEGCGTHDSVVAKYWG